MVFNARKADARRRVRAAAEIMEEVMRNVCPENPELFSALAHLRLAVGSAEKAIDGEQVERKLRDDITKEPVGENLPFS